MSGLPSEAAIAREMAETGFDRLTAIRRLKQVAAILRERDRALIEGPGVAAPTGILRSSAKVVGR